MYIFTSELWQYKGESSWYFLTLPSSMADEIKALTAQHKKGFGSIKVCVKVGMSEWQTSIFPDKKTKSYLLPLKKEIRIKNALQHGDMVKAELIVLEEYM